MSEEAKLIIVQVRVTPLQHSRLKAVSDADGLSMQEHLRRAADIYLAAMERPRKTANQG